MALLLVGLEGDDDDNVFVGKWCMDRTAVVVVAFRITTNQG
jgi:hypothetical protein